MLIGSKSTPWAICAEVPYFGTTLAQVFETSRSRHGGAEAEVWGEPMEDFL